MVRFASAIWLIFSLIGGLYSPLAYAKAVDLPQIHILADPSLTLPLAEISRNYSQTHGVAVTTSFAPTSEQKNRVISGMQANIFITTRTDELQDLKNRGLVDVYSEKSIISNRLVLATLADNPLELVLIRNTPVGAILSKKSGHFTFAIGDPEHQMVGRHTLEALENFSLTGELEPHYLVVRSPVELHKAVASDHGYGIMLQSEIARNPNIKKLDIFPQDSHTPIIYRAVIVASEDMSGSRGFMEYLSSNEMLAIFKKYGFDAP